MVRITWARNCFNKGYFVYFYFFIFFLSFPSVFCRGAVISSRFIICVFWLQKAKPVCTCGAGSPTPCLLDVQVRCKVLQQLPIFSSFLSPLLPGELTWLTGEWHQGGKNNVEMAMIKATWQQCHCITGGCGLKPAAGEGFVKEPLWELMRWSEFHLVINSPLPSTCSVLWLKYC